MEAIQRLGHKSAGWDPVHAPDSAKHEADVVNLGFVLNVIEDPAERVDALLDAWKHTRRALLVSISKNASSPRTIRTGRNWPGFRPSSANSDSAKKPSATGRQKRSGIPDPRQFLWKRKTRDRPKFHSSARHDCALLFACLRNRQKIPGMRNGKRKYRSFAILLTS